jgi:ABC-2 type transport system permease protein
MTVTYMAYFAAFVGVSLAVSAVAKSSRLALVTLLGFWIFNGLAAPRLAADLSRAVYPAPSSYAFTQEMEAELKKGYDAKELERSVLAKYKVGSLKELPVNFAGIALEAGEEHGNQVYDRMFSALWGTYRQQEHLQQALGAVAPLLAARSLSMSFAGTDFVHFERFARASEAYRRQLITVMNEDITTNSRPEDRGYLGGEALWRKVPEFRYEMPAPAEMLGGEAISIAVLSGWALMGAAVALWASERKLRVE